MAVIVAVAVALAMAMVPAPRKVKQQADALKFCQPFKWRQTCGSGRASRADRRAPLG